jgi:membrane associated rhomboid family serine protease
MRRNPFDSRRSVTVTLLAINVAAFIAQMALESFSSMPVGSYCALSLDGLKHGYVWQLVTYQFMHANLMHLLVNCWAIFVFGRDVEEVLGRKPFLTLYLSSGIIGGLVQALAGLALGPMFSGPVVGASAAAFGLSAAFAALFPDRVLLLFFIIPIRAKYLLVLGGVLAVLGIVSHSDNVAHAAHLGGLLAGFAFVRYGLNWNWNWHWHWPRWRSRRPALRRVAESGPAIGSFRKAMKPETDEELPPEEFLSREVDPILDKISAKGIQSLTARERRILEAAREKMVRR